MHLSATHGALLRHVSTSDMFRTARWDVHVYLHQTLWICWDIQVYSSILQSSAKIVICLEDSEMPRQTLRWCRMLPGVSKGINSHVNQTSEKEKANKHFSKWSTCSFLSQLSSLFPYRPLSFVGTKNLCFLALMNSWEERGQWGRRGGGHLGLWGL